eukprot:SAG25_NODE_72_length_17288_cov_26.538775_5_plen_70_part_00
MRFISGSSSEESSSSAMSLAYQQRDNAICTKRGGKTRPTDRPTVSRSDTSRNIFVLRKLVVIDYRTQSV